MAFTTEEKLSISTIVGVTPTLLDAQLASLGTSLTADVEAAVRTELTRWATSGAKFVKIHPTESNKGVETDSGNAKTDIIRNIALLLELPFAYSLTASMGTLQVGS
jgi:hypothetical protein